MSLNNIIAAPSFQSWIRGEPLNVQSLLYQPDGRAHVSIFYLAHLNEAERQFIITLLLENVLSWMRSLSGTTSLRALLYVDEMYGYFPPYPLNPPTKEPILRLLKQARAFGLGLILATQNPGDLDYKGLSNAGTWFIGRLQSENDRNRVMTGLQSMATAVSEMNLRDVERLVADIEPRVFLMHNIHNTGGPVLVHTRWAMSYLRGPLTRQQIQTLMAGQKQHLLSQMNAAAHPAHAAAYMQAPGGYAPTGVDGGYGLPLPPMPPAPPEFRVQAAPPGFTESPTMPMPPDTMGFTQATVPPGQTGFGQVTSGTQATARAGLPPGYNPSQPPVTSSIAQFFLPAAHTSQQAIAQWEQQTRFAITSMGTAMLAYVPVLLAQAVVRYQDRKASIYTARTFAYHVPNLQRAGLVHWDEHQAAPVDARRLSQTPLGDAIYGDVPPSLTDSRRLTALRNELVDMLYNTAALRIPFNPTLNVYANPDGDFSEFRAQAQQIARERRDAEVDQVAARYEKIISRLEEQYQRKTRELSAEKKELADRRREELFTRGEALLSLLRGRTTYTLSRTSRVQRYRRQTQENMRESKEVLAQIEQQLEETEARFEGEVQALNDRWAKAAVEVQEYAVTPFKKDIQVELFGIGWLPQYFVMVNGQPLLLPAT